MSSSPIMFAYVIANRIKNRAYLLGQIAHARRTSPTAETRPGAIPGTALKWAIVPDANDYEAALKLHMDQQSAEVRGSYALGLHLLIGVSPEWVEETGDPHDPRNWRNVQLLKEAVQFVEQTIGGVFAARLDLDELGAGLVDVFAAPVRVNQGRSTKSGIHLSAPRRQVSVRKALQEAKKRTGEMHEFASMQTLWAQHARTALDHRLMRGKLKSQTGREHLSPVEFRQQRAEIARQLDEVQGRQATAMNHAARVYASEVELKKREAEFAERTKRFEADLKRHREQALLAEMTAGILQAETAAEINRASEEIAKRERSVIVRERQFARGQDIFNQQVDALAGRQRNVATTEADLSSRVGILEKREAEFATAKAALESQVVEIADIARLASMAKRAIQAKTRSEPGDELIVEHADGARQAALKALRLTGVKLSGRDHGR